MPSLGRFTRDAPAHSAEQILRRAHSDIPTLELAVSRAEAEIGECERMIDMRKDAARRHLHWVDMLAEAKRDFTRAEMDLAGQVGNARYIYIYMAREKGCAWGRNNHVLATWLRVGMLPMFPSFFCLSDSIH